MKSLMWVPGGVLIGIASPAWAAAADANDNAVWIALGVVFLGAFSAVFGGVVAKAAKKRKPPAGDK